MSANKGKGPVFDPGLCRCCGNMKKCRVLNIEYESLGQKEVYSDMIMDCFGLVLSHLDGAPSERLICATCVTRIRDGLSFRKQVLQCEEAFLQMKIYDARCDESSVDNKMVDVLMECTPKVKIEMVKTESLDIEQSDDEHCTDALADAPDDDVKPDLMDQDSNDDLPLKQHIEKAKAKETTSLPVDKPVPLKLEPKSTLLPPAVIPPKQTIVNTKAFITEIFKRPPLWNSSHPYHKYKNVITELWNEVQRYFPAFEVDHLKRKWKNLKDSYRKELKKLPISGDLDTDTLSQWKHFKMLKFLNEEFIQAESQRNANVTTVDETGEFEDCSQIKEGSQPSESFQPQTSSSRNEKSISPRKRSKIDDLRVEYIKIEKKKLKLLQQEIARRNDNKSDVEKTDDYYFLMSLLPEIQKLNPLKKMRLRNHINQFFIDVITIETYEVV